MARKKRPLDYDNMDWCNAESSAVSIQYALQRLELEHLTQNGVILDIGCGDGKLSAKIAKRYPDAKVCGFDYSVDTAKKNYPRGDFREGDIAHMPFDSSTITIATANNIFDYAAESKDLIDAHGTLSRVKPVTFKIAELENEARRVLVLSGLLILFEENIVNYLSPDEWALFDQHFESLHPFKTDCLKLYKKLF
ncbi:MAG: class I SAM-dependent methyltransferase [Candidatus Aenigmatarchaeota archaeon]